MAITRFIMSCGNLAGRKNCSGFCAGIVTLLRGGASRVLISAAVSLLLAVGLARADSNTANSLSNVNPALTTYGGASYPAQIYNFDAFEDSTRWSEQGFANMVSPFASANACLGGTGAGLVMTPTACVAYNAGLRGTETGSITFPNASTCWVAMDENTTGGNAGIPGFTRAGSTHYLIDCVDVGQPSMASDTQLLMKVVTSGGAITTVTDLRNTNVSFANAGASAFGSIQVTSSTPPIWAASHGTGLWSRNFCLDGVSAGVTGAVSCANGMAVASGDKETDWSWYSIVLSGQRLSSTPPTLSAGTANTPSVIITAPVSGTGHTLDLRDPTGTSTLAYIDATGNANLGQTEATQLTWAGGADLTEVNQQRSTATYTTQVALSTAQAFGRWIPTVASTIRRVTYDLGVNGATCSPAAVQAISVNGADQVSTQVTLSNGAGVFDVAGLTVAVGAGQAVRVHESVAATGCGTVPANESVTIEYTTN